MKYQLSVILSCRLGSEICTHCDGERFNNEPTLVVEINLQQYGTLKIG